MPDVLDAFARRLRGDGAFLASAMEEYARSEGLDGDGLAQRLGIRAEELGLLGLCKRPAGERFAEDVRTIAQRFGIDETALAEMVRRADALGVLRTGRQDVGGLVAAARDRAMYEVAAPPPMAMDALPFGDEPGASPEDPEPGDDTDEDEPS